MERDNRGIGFDTEAAKESLEKLMSAHYDGNDNGNKSVLLRGESSNVIAETEGWWKLIYDSTNRRNISDFPHDWSLYVDGGREGLDVHFCTAAMGVLFPGDGMMMSRLFPEHAMESLVEIIARKDPSLAVDMSEWKGRTQAAVESAMEPGERKKADGGISASEETEARIKALQLSDMKDSLEFFLAEQMPETKGSVRNGSESLLNDNIRKGNWVVIKHDFDRDMNPVRPAGWTLAFRGDAVCECRDRKTLCFMDEKLTEEQRNAIKDALESVSPGLALKKEVDGERIGFIKKNATHATPDMDIKAMLEKDRQRTEKQNATTMER